MRSNFDIILQRRMNWILLFFLAALTALIGRLFMLQIVYHKEYVELASKQQTLVKNILSERGAIFAQDKSGNLVPLALNKRQEILIASPKDIKNPEAIAEILTISFNLRKEDILPKLTKAGDPHEVLLKNVELEVAEKFEKLNIRGLFFEDDKKRVYPHKATGAHFLGFVSKENGEAVGKYGLEKFYDDDLSGEKGIFKGAKGAASFFMNLGRRIISPPENGSNLTLTVDFNIQKKAEEVLDAVKKKWQAYSAAVLVLEPKTGKILALAGNKSYDPNEFSKESDFSIFLNPLVESTYELGSVLKPITMAGGLEEGLVGPDTTYEDPGEIKFGGYTIKNFDGKSYKTQTMTQVLEKSLNTGAVHVSRLLGKERQLAYIKKFGFGEKTGIDLPGEVTGNISNLKAGRDIDFATASFGQGMAVTPLQLAMAIGAIANGGELLKPYLVERIKDDSGNEIKKEAQIVRQVISKEKAEILTKMLVSAVRSGFENRAGVKGYFVAGKTGTAQIPRSDGRGYDPDKVIHTFVGYAPAFNPKFLVLLQLNEPRGNRFAANTLTPAFHDLAEYILNYYEIPPDEPR